ncbi:MAG: rhodanese-like domain-containing protein [Burkholderiaceae bacterium]
MNTRLCAVLLASIAVVEAKAQVVADEACPLYAVDVAAFATCDGDRVAGFNRGIVTAALLPEERVPISKRTALGLYVDARGAHRLKQDNPDRVVLIDVRSRIEVGVAGQAVSVDAHVPLLDAVLPLRWDDDSGGWAMTPNPQFAAEIAGRLDRLGVGRNAPIVLMCRSGGRSALAADRLAELGYTQAISVIDGFEGDVAPDGRRSINGWKNAGLPWTARPVASIVYGAR